MGSSEELGGMHLRFLCSGNGTFDHLSTGFSLPLVKGGPCTNSLYLQPVPGASPVDSVGICTTGSRKPWADTATLLLSRAVLKPVQFWPLQQPKRKE